MSNKNRAIKGDMEEGQPDEVIMDTVYSHMATLGVINASWGKS